MPARPDPFEKSPLMCRPGPLEKPLLMCRPGPARWKNHPSFDSPLEKSPLIAGPGPCRPLARSHYYVSSCYGYSLLCVIIKCSKNVVRLSESYKSDSKHNFQVRFIPFEHFITKKNSVYAFGLFVCSRSDSRKYSSNVLKLIYVIHI